jgi:Zn-dependent protease with chaperone function
MQERTPDVPEFISTHPSDERRIRDIEAAIPEALTYYNPTR